MIPAGVVVAAALLLLQHVLVLLEQVAVGLGTKARLATDVADMARVASVFLFTLSRLVHLVGVANLGWSRHSASND